MPKVIIEKNKMTDNFVYQHNYQPKDNDDQNVQYIDYIRNNVMNVVDEKNDMYNNIFVEKIVHL